MIFSIILILGTTQITFAIPPPGFVLQETIDPVPITSTAVTSSTTLQSGVDYKIRITGKFFIGGPGQADAEWAFTSANTGEIDHCFGDPNDIDLGVGINDAVVDNDKQPEYGAFATNHIYEIDFTGLGSTIDVNYHDCFYGDNVYLSDEQFILEIFAPESASPVGGELIPLDTTMILLAGTQTTASWLIPVIVSAIGIGIIIARKF